MSRASIRMGAWLSHGHEDGHRHRLRFRLDAGLCLRERGARARLRRPHDRPHLPRRHRLARHPPAQAASGRADRQRCRGAEGGRPSRAHLLDIAAGHGRYVLDAVAKCAEPPASVRLQDYSDINVGLGSQADRRAAICRPASPSTRPTPSTPKMLAALEAGAGPRHRLRPLRAVRRQCADRPLARRTGAAPCSPAACSSTPTSPGIRSWR